MCSTKYITHEGVRQLISLTEIIIEIQIPYLMGFSKKKQKKGKCNNTQLPMSVDISVESVVLLPHANEVMYYTCLSVILFRGARGVSQHAMGRGHTPPGRPPWATPPADNPPVFGLNTLGPA